MDTYLVAYDIADPKRLRKVARTCDGSSAGYAAGCQIIASVSRKATLCRSVRSLDSYESIWSNVASSAPASMTAT